jgi:hypothetical protein
MDTETVFKIISMLDAQIKQHNQALLLCNDDDFVTISACKWGLIFFRDKLQEYIELQVTQAENALGE